MDRDAAVEESFVPSKPNGPMQADGGSPGTSPDGGISAAGCGRGPDAKRKFTKGALLETFAECALLQYCEAETLAQAFAQAASDYAQEPTNAAQTKAKDTWYYAMQRWQLAELFRFGPAAPSMEPGGQSLRDQIYAFPSVSRCTIEEQILSQGYAKSIATVPFNARGLGAAEYLLFFEGTTNSCSTYSALNYPAPGSWAGLSAQELEKRKIAYLAEAAADVHARIRQLLEAWRPEGGNFARELATAGHGSSVYASEQTGLNAVSHALFYLDKELKDWKVGRPSGLMECGTDCASYAESPYARVGADSVRANLEGFRLLFQGCARDYAGLGFDDWLRAVGMGGLADDMLSALDGADRAMRDFPLDQRIVEDPATVAPVHAAIKRVTDLLKTDFVSALDLEIPMSIEGDND